MAALRSGTRRQHRDTERRLDGSGWLESPLSYAGYLVRLLSFHRMVEATVGPVAAGLAGLDYQRRIRTPVIEADLRALAAAGVTAPTWTGPGARPAAPAVSPGVSDALGRLYVVEGATLGGRITAGRVRRALGFGEGRGASSLQPYGDATADMWRRFASVVERWAAGDGDRQAAMVDAARRTFAAYSTLVIDPGPGSGPSRCTISRLHTR